MVISITLQPKLPSADFDLTGLAREMHAVLVDGAADLIDRMADYPAQRPGATYMRTGDYGRGWQVAELTGATVEVSNNVEYAPWVGGSRKTWPGQARVMDDLGWTSIDDVTAGIIDSMTAELQDVLANAKKA